MNVCILNECSRQICPMSAVDEAVSRLTVSRVEVRSFETGGNHKDISARNSAIMCFTKSEVIAHTNGFRHLSRRDSQY